MSYGQKERIKVSAPFKNDPEKYLQNSKDPRV